MKTAAAAKVRKAIKACPDCNESNLWSLKELKEPVDWVAWVPRPPTGRSKKRLTTLLEASRSECLVGNASEICSTHRDLVVRKSKVLFEVEFAPDGTTDDIVPIIRKGRTWWRMFWRDPSKVTDETYEAWTEQGRRLGRMIKGLEKLPAKKPRRMMKMTPAMNRDTFEYRLEAHGYVKVYSKLMGETILVLRDDEIRIPKGPLSSIPQFTFDELVKLGHLKGQEPNNEIMEGVWLMKKHLNATVVQ